MEFYEDSIGPLAVPDWVSYLISVGYAWLDYPSSSRRIALISLPGDSAAAGLVALGALLKCLELEVADDESAHYERIKSLANKNPDGLTLRHATEDGVFCFDSIDANGTPWVYKQRKPSERRNIVSARVSNWRIYDEPFVAVGIGGQNPFGEIYRNLLTDGAEIIEYNLNRSYSLVCLGVRAAGKSVTRDIFRSVQFSTANRPVDLATLLTVTEWSTSIVSRMNVYNSRTQKFDRQTGATRLVIADGHEAFLRILDEPTFKCSDVIGVYDRVQERSKLEEIGAKMESLRDWYYDWDASHLSNPPHSINVKTFVKR
jgi:hypothetical protein